MSCSSSISIPEGSLRGGVTDGATNVKWCAQIARNLSEVGESRSTPLRLLGHDRDHRFGEVFDKVFKAEGVEIIRTPWREQMLMPNVSSGPSAPRASTGSLCSANATSSQC